MIDLDQLGLNDESASNQLVPGMVDTSDIARRIESLPPMPIVVQEILTLAESANADAAAYEELFSKDQLLTAQLLKMVNSPFFRRSKEIATIPDAVVALGLNSVKTLVLANFASGGLKVDAALYQHTPEGLFEHAIATAATAKLLCLTSKPMSNALADELFVAGLMHDVGKVVLAPLAIAIAPVDGADVLANEEAIFSTNHIEVASRVLSAWRITGDINLWITNHHRANASEPGPMACLQLADQLTNSWGIGRTEDYRTLPPSRRLIKALEISDADLIEIEAQARTQLSEANLS
ncbi:MAG: HDOD domain-containing protein [Pseudomonadota bacterium]